MFCCTCIRRTHYDLCTQIYKQKFNTYTLTRTQICGKNTCLHKFIRTCMYIRCMHARMLKITRSHKVSYIRALMSLAIWPDIFTDALSKWPHPYLGKRETSLCLLLLNLVPHLLLHHLHLLLFLLNILLCPSFSLLILLLYLPRHIEDSSPPPPPPPLLLPFLFLFYILPSFFSSSSSYISPSLSLFQKAICSSFSLSLSL